MPLLLDSFASVAAYLNMQSAIEMMCFHWERLGWWRKHQCHTIAAVSVSSKDYACEIIWQWDDVSTPLPTCVSNIWPEQMMVSGVCVCVVGIGGARVCVIGVSRQKCDTHTWRHTASHLFIHPKQEWHENTVKCFCRWSLKLLFLPAVDCTSNSMKQELRHHILFRIRILEFNLNHMRYIHTSLKIYTFIILILLVQCSFHCVSKIPDGKFFAFSSFLWMILYARSCRSVENPVKVFFLLHHTV